MGSVSSKLAALETKDFLKHRLDEAARYVAPDDLCLSPQCSFASTHHGNDIDEEDQWRKLALVVETTADIWPGQR